jgi:TRAP transporter TAXI family solute receptor
VKQQRCLQLAFIVATVAVAIAGLVLTFAVLRPTPPRSVVMTTGPEGSAYARIAAQYRELLAHEGVELELRSTGGALENLDRLNDPESGVSIGFVSGGTTTADQSPDLRSLGTLFDEPFWAFVRGADTRSAAVESLRGSRLAIGPEGSRSRLAALTLLRLLGLDETFAELLPLTATEAESKLHAGDLQGVMTVSPAEAPVVRRLMGAPDVTLISFARADAYTMLYPFLTKLNVPAGIGDLALNRPPHDATVLAFQASLAVREDLHPAVQFLLLDAASRIHGGPGMFHRAGRFPAPEAIDLPLSDTATQYYKSGRPFLQRYLPFWLAVFVAQLLVAAIPIVGVLYPALKLMPAVYGWAVRWRLNRLYGELKFLELQVDKRPTLDDESLRIEFDRLETRILALRVPVAYAHLRYALRAHFNLVRSTMDRGRAGRG